ncbi:protein shisa-5-like [Thalassophryne amazonica]|uniref:protein shisa-5-like n=1 Tax=Thalassophryne amazonica TaxID=390379 RepID=UPI0014719CB3|nr:protein shisa-5-like [Thalassophryne amazonica]
MLYQCNMVLKVFSCLVCVLYVILLPTACADECSGFWDIGGIYHETRQCGLLYCCGSCDERFCCINTNSRLDQELCIQTPQRHYGYGGGSHSSIIFAAIFGSLIPLVIFVTLIICFFAPCCLLYKHCQKQRHQPAIHTTTTVYQLSPQPGPTANPGYQPVPIQPGNLPMTPPPYTEYSQPIYPPHRSGPPYSQPPPTEVLVQPPYNPSYAPNPRTG